MRPAASAVPAAVLAVLLVLAAGCAGPPQPVEPRLVRALQLNLCGSGVASCWTGRAPDEAVAVVRRTAPEVVTLNEVCDSDVTAVEAALARATAGPVSSVFRAARDGRTGEPYRCRDGRQYGIGVVARGPAAVPPVSGVHPAQDPADPEQRVWACLVPEGGAPAACTTHLAYTDRAVAAAQCRYLFDVVVPERRVPVVVGADLNLGTRAEVDACLPAGVPRADDGGPQRLVGPPGSALVGVANIDLRGATDHPALFVTLAPPRAPAGPVR